jgi:hypothetical protein
MTQPEGFPQGERGQLLKLHKSIYGLKQGGWQWHKKLLAKLLSMGFSYLQSDHLYCLTISLHCRCLKILNIMVT